MYERLLPLEDLQSLLAALQVLSEKDMIWPEDRKEAAEMGVMKNMTPLARAIVSSLLKYIDVGEMKDFSRLSATKAGLEKFMEVARRYLDIFPG